MPAGDNTGPEGMGPMTGRGAGYCAGNDEPGFTDAGYGRPRRGMRGRGRGMAYGPRGGFGLRGRPRRGQGMGYRAAPPVYPGAYEYTEEQEAADLKAEAWLASATTRTPSPNGSQN